MEQYPVTSTLLTYWNLATEITSRTVSKEAGITLTQYSALRLVFNYAGKAAVTDICSDLEISRSQAGKLVSKLVELGMIDKQSSYAGNYAARLSLSKKGSETLLRSDSCVAQAMVSFMLPAKPLFDSVTKQSRSWIMSGFSVSREPWRTPFGRELDIGDVVRFGLHGAERVERIVSSSARNQGLTKLEYRILLAISEQNAEIRATDLADILIAKQSNISVAIKNLIARKIIRSERSPKDSRSTLLSMTKAGVRSCNKVTALINETLMELSGSDSTEIRATYVEISRLCVNAERKRRRID